MLRPRLGVRTRILAIALVPSIALLVIGVGAAGVLVTRSNDARTWADEMRAGVAPTRELIEAIQLERQITLWHYAGEDPESGQLTAARIRLDDALRAIAPTQDTLDGLGSESMSESTAAMRELGRQLLGVRAQVDAGALLVGDAYAFYSRVPDIVVAAIGIAQQTAPNAATSAELGEAAQILLSVEAMSRANALGAALANGGGLTADLAAEYLRLVGYYRTRIELVGHEADADQAAAAKTLVSGSAWQRLGAMETVLSQRAMPRPDSATQRSQQTTATPLPLTIPEWQTAATEVNRDLTELWQAQSQRSQSLAAEAAAETARKSQLAALAMLLVALGAMGVAFLLANRIIRRLKRLRDRTFALADEELPETMRKLSAGEYVAVEEENPRLDFGNDEIGQVADAFSHAHAAAVSAAVTEARTREGVKSVFLNIAHRSQVVVHRQLEILDEAEARQEDPTLLDTFFRLDHLATRERRNAENLIILAGGQPGRQWRHPIPLLDLVRSAIGETLDYTRIRTTRMPRAFIVGVVVADLIHLLAELLDNATAFSPPQSRVEISAATVGKGVALEITDQGMGIVEPELQRINDLLDTPPDFGVTALSEDSRLGLFVISRIAHRHGISVRLTESDYGGIRAIVVVPAGLIAAELGAPELPAGPAAPAERPEPYRPSPEPDSTPTTTLPRPIVAPTLTTPAPPPAPDRPHLPRRRRQASLAPELAQEPPAEDTGQQPANPQRTAEQARDMFSAIENGTRQGRRATPQPYPAAEDTPRR
ncbi:nitrate- and nitrite sensing domain-containing protein [Nocardia sp. NPDC050406]|uniref:sensor histidine kinase n=1 Tax=Nocardia sp. NPDC050406 TaxID=3364318 RepID=UPI00378C55F4